MSNSTRQSIRKSCISTRQKLSKEIQSACSKRICTQIQMLNQYQNAKNIAFYYAMNGEVDLLALWHISLKNKLCYFPTMTLNQSLIFLPATLQSSFYANEYGILEPQVDHAQALSPECFDLMLVPLVAFDPFGTRLGMGKGFYDRTLSNGRPKFLLGIAYEFQKQNYIETHPWDVRLDAILTEQTIYWSPSS